MNLSNMSIDSSLGFLAIRDVAFVEWRKIKTAHNVMISGDSKINK